MSQPSFGGHRTRCLCLSRTGGRRMVMRDCPLHGAEVRQVLPWVPFIIRADTSGQKDPSDG